MHIREESRHLPIFPGRRHPSIFGTNELNFCVRHGNRWILVVIGTGYALHFAAHSLFSSLFKVTFSCTLKTEYRNFEIPPWQMQNLIKELWSSPRPISTRWLNASPHLHRVPIYLVVFKGTYLFPVGYLIFGPVSRLDAFSVYPIRT